MIIPKSLIRIWFYVSIFLLCACSSPSENDIVSKESGQSSLEDSELGSTGPVTTENATTEPEETNPNLSTSDLYTDGDFTFESFEELNIEIDSEYLSESRAYINLCRKGNNEKIDYSNCILKQPLSGGYLKARVAVGYEIQSLELAIWQYTADAPVIYDTWSRSLDGMLWKPNL
jgi:hypothetical protein